MTGPILMPPSLEKSGVVTIASSSPTTPGPWIACNMVHAERGDQMTPDEVGEYVANAVRLGDPSRFLFITTEEEGGVDICHVGNGPSGPANAHLIAAAPDLLEALEDFDNWFACFNPDDQADRMAGRKVVIRARAAIAKARALTCPMCTTQIDPDTKVCPSCKEPVA